MTHELRGRQSRCFLLASPGGQSKGARQLTKGNHDPGHVEADIVDPVVERLGPAVAAAGGAVLGPGGGVVEGHAVEVRRADDHGEAVAGGRAGERGRKRQPAERAPDELRSRRQRSCSPRRREGALLTTVAVSTQTVKTSDVMYRESPSAYSFHSCAAIVCCPAMLARFSK